MSKEMKQTSITGGNFGALTTHKVQHLTPEVMTASQFAAADGLLVPAAVTQQSRFSLPCARFYVAPVA